MSVNIGFQKAIVIINRSTWFFTNEWLSSPFETVIPHLSEFTGVDRRLLDSLTLITIIFNQVIIINVLIFKLNKLLVTLYLVALPDPI
jgi:hypothetical protein